MAHASKLGGTRFTAPPAFTAHPWVNQPHHHRAACNWMTGHTTHRSALQGVSYSLTDHSTDHSTDQVLQTMLVCMLKDSQQCSPDGSKRVSQRDGSNRRVVKAPQLLCSCLAVVLQQICCYVGWHCQHYCPRLDLFLAARCVVRKSEGVIFAFGDFLELPAGSAHDASQLCYAIWALLSTAIFIAHMGNTWWLHM